MIMQCLPQHHLLSIVYMSIAGVSMVYFSSVYFGIVCVSMSGRDRLAQDLSYLTGSRLVSCAFLVLCVCVCVCVCVRACVHACVCCRLTVL